MVSPLVPKTQDDLLQYAEALVDVSCLPQHQPLTARLGHTLTACQVYQSNLGHKRIARLYGSEHGTQTDTWTYP